MEITKNNAQELWKDAIALIKEKGEDFTDNDNRVCIEITNLTLNLENVPNSEIDEPIKTMINTNKWIYPTKEELSSIMFKEYQAPIYEYTYGGRIFNYGKEFNQINSFIIPLLKKDPHTRRAIITLYSPEEDSIPENKNTPGLIYMHFRIKNEQLNTTCHIRSNDIFFGWPANIYQIYSLAKLVAEKLNIKIGKITTISNSAHVFKEDFLNAEEIIK